MVVRQLSATVIATLLLGIAIHSGCTLGLAGDTDESLPGANLPSASLASTLSKNLLLTTATNSASDIIEALPIQFTPEWAAATNSTQAVATSTTTPLTVYSTDSTVAPTSTITEASPINLIPDQIGRSASNRPIFVYRLGTGPIHVVLVGGIHGGYEWNTVLLVKQLLEHAQLQPDLVPDSLTLHIVPNANPDGLFLVTGQEESFLPSDVAADSRPGRFNGNGVDLNRNWDCNWSPTALWRDQIVSGGTHPFSEPETEGLRDFFLEVKPVVVVFWHSAANGVYVSGCPNPHGASFELASVFGQAAGYPVYSSFNYYPITGDAGDWLTTQEVASFTVELITHETLDWEQNLAGFTALLNYLDQQIGDRFPSNRTRHVFE
jgi:hypothetical protein